MVKTLTIIGTVKEDGFYIRLRVWKEKKMDDYKEQDDSDLQRIKLFREWLHTAPHGEFHSINETWNDEGYIRISCRLCNNKINNERGGRR